LPQQQIIPTFSRMIIRKKEHWFKMLLVWQGSVLPKLLPQLLLLLAWSVAVVIFRDTIFHYNLHLNPAPFTLFGIALALFLGFRNNASYDRFWEGRKLWGSLMNTGRALARQALTLVDEPDETAASHSDPASLAPVASAGAPTTRTLFINQAIALAYTLKHQLRKTDGTADLARLLPPATAARIGAARFPAAAVIKEMGIWTQQARHQNRLDSPRQVAIDSNLNELAAIVGGCERLSNTPLPYSYSVLIHRTVYIYCFLLPLGLLDSLGWMVPPIVVFIAYTYTALEAIADELEDPFGMAPNDLALDTMCRSIENALLEMDDRPLRPDPPPAATDRWFLT
jgi:ion channel-forming bestrophin family protein